METEPYRTSACYHSTTFLELATIYGPPPNLLELKGAELIKL
jgi:hypothetical protein